MGNAMGSLLYSSSIIHMATFATETINLYCINYTLQNTEEAIKNGPYRETGNTQDEDKQQHCMYWTPLCASKHK